MKVNLGCGRFKLDGFVNVDVNEDLQPDVVAFAQDYMETLPDDSVDLVYMGHMIEHITSSSSFPSCTVMCSIMWPM